MDNEKKSCEHRLAALFFLLQKRPITQKISFSCQKSSLANREWTSDATGRAFDTSNEAFDTSNRVFFRTNPTAWES